MCRRFAQLCDALLVRREDMLRAINAADFSFADPGWARVSDEALAVVTSLLQRDPLDRPVLEEVLQHPFCADAVEEAVLLSQSRMKVADMEQVICSEEPS